MGSEISQPTDSDLIQMTEKSYRSCGTIRKIYFLESWFKQLPWVHFCKSRMMVFCYYCKRSHDSRIRESMSLEERVVEG